MAGLGLSISQIAASLGISKSSLDRRLSEDSEAKEALEKGRSKAVQDIANVAFEMAKSGRYPVMTIFWLKCRAGWLDSKTGIYDEEITGIEFVDE